MKPLSAHLPPGLSPEPTPAQAGPSPAPGADCKPAPGVCELCAWGHVRIGTKHYEVSDKGIRFVGMCSNPPTFEIRSTPPAPKRSHEECMEQLRAKANTSAAASVLTNPGRGSAAAHGMPREPGCDDD